MTTTIIQASTPTALKDQVDALIGAGKTISLIVELSQKSFYLVLHSV